MCSEQRYCPETDGGSPSLHSCMRERLQKIIAASGICSRRKAEELIAAGRVEVNGTTARLGDTAEPSEDEILLDGKRLAAPEKKRTLLLYKPRGYVTTAADEKGRKLSARLLKAEGNVFVIGAHGYRTSAMKDFRYIAKFYHDRGMNLLLADHPAAGESEGSMISFGRDESRAMLCWIEYLKNRFGGDIKIIIHGFSMGASTAMLLADNEAILPNVRFIIADCGYTDMGYQIDRTLKKYGKHTGLLMATLSATSRLVRGFGFGEVRPVDHIKNTLVPILFVHGSRDNITPVEKAQELFNACGGPKDILVVEGAGHMASYRKAPEEYEKAIDAFSGKYIR